MNKPIQGKCCSLRVDHRKGVEYKYSAEWTRKLESLRHWEFYWYQQKLMEEFVERWSGETILELGVGSGFAANYCRSHGFEVTTLDIDSEKKPDIVANVVDYEFKNKCDHLMAFEVFEHIPYSEFERIVFLMPQFVRKYAFISLPRNEMSLIDLRLKLPKIRAIQWSFRMRGCSIRTESHHWELDSGEITTNRVESLFGRVGLKIEKRMRRDYIRFYALSVA